ncbi:MAG: 2Fe-2S iron-sulfur cluster binding domain-containing protein, partial [Phycisphaerae bacterium]|nr:2Fe-2S iron-sulfur cluster binding domain-containing protein [Phycisphaerae bacterium]
MMRTHEILFQPDGIRVNVETDSTLTEAAERAGITLNTFCGQRGTCKKCVVEIGSPSKNFLACQYHVCHDETVTIPESSRFFEQKILQDGISKERDIDPVVCKHFLELSEPSLDDIRCDARRLTDAVGGGSGALSHTCFDHGAHADIQADLALLRTLP